MPDLRESLVAYAAATFSELLDEVKVGKTDTGNGLRYPLDRVLSALGDRTDSDAAYALTDYHVLLRIQRAVSAEVDAQGTGFSAGKGGQIHPRIKFMLEEATERVAAFGYPLGASPELTGGADAFRVTLDFIQPQE